MWLRCNLSKSKCHPSSSIWSESPIITSYKSKTFDWKSNNLQQFNIYQILNTQVPIPHWSSANQDRTVLGWETSRDLLVLRTVIWSLMLLMLGLLIPPIERKMNGVYDYLHDWITVKGCCSTLIRCQSLLRPWWTSSVGLLFLFPL